MCSPQQAVGVKSLSQQAQDLRKTTDNNLAIEQAIRVQGVESAKRDARKAERDALVRAGRRFGRQASIGVGGRQNPALGGAL